MSGDIIPGSKDLEGKSTEFKPGFSIILLILGPDLNREPHKNSTSEVGKPSSEVLFSACQSSVVEHNLEPILESKVEGGYDISPKSYLRSQSSRKNEPVLQMMSSPDCGNQAAKAKGKS